MQTSADHTSSLLRSVPSSVLRERGPRGTVYEVGIRLPNGPVLTVRVELPPDFPNLAPIIRIADQGVTHPWLDANGRVVGLSMLYHWNARTSDLGQVVQAALTEFCMRPPNVTPGFRAAAQAAAAVPVQQQFVSQPVMPVPQPIAKPNVEHEHSSKDIQLPPIPDAYPELENLDDARLKQLMVEEEAYAIFFNNLAVVNDVQQLRDSLRGGNAGKARENVSVNQELTKSLANIEVLKGRFSKARLDFSAVSSQSAHLIGPAVQPSALPDEFDRLARDIDEESEALMSNLYNDPSAMDANLAKYRAMRVEYHTRKMKADRCRAQLSD